MDKAIIYLPDDRRQTGLPAPLMLWDVLGCPLLRWTTEALGRAGISSFFMICKGEFNKAAERCFPVGAQVQTAEPGSHIQPLRTFMRDQSRLVVVTKPVLPMSALLDFLRSDPDDCGELGKGSGLYIASFSGILADMGGNFKVSDTREIAVCTYGLIPIDSLEDIFSFGPDAQKDFLLSLADAGVQMWDISNLYVAPTARVAPGASLLPGTILKGNTEIGPGCVIGPNSLIEDSVIGEGTRVNASQVYGSRIGSHTAVGPFAYIRPDCEIGDHVKVGDFVEVKNSVIGDGTKISHLTYVGDSDLGKNINLGCGTVTVNYDGMAKFRTVIEDGAFIGCNTNLIAPVHVGPGAYTAAGSTITSDVPGSALAVARARQENKENWVSKRKDR